MTDDLDMFRGRMASSSAARTSVAWKRASRTARRSEDLDGHKAIFGAMLPSDGGIPDD